jgi:hypothetical protein
LLAGSPKCDRNSTLNFPMLLLLLTARPVAVSTRLYPEHRTSKHVYSNLRCGTKRLNKRLDWPKVVKQIPRSTILDYLVYHATHPYAVICTRPMESPKFCWCRSIFAHIGNTIDVSGAILLRTWRKTQYTIQELWDNQWCDLLLTSTGVTVNCDIIQSRFSLKKTFRHIFNIWLSHVNPKFFTFWWKSPISSPFL